METQVYVLCSEERDGYGNYTVVLWKAFANERTLIAYLIAEHWPDQDPESYALNEVSYDAHVRSLKGTDGEVLVFPGWYFVSTIPLVESN